MTTLSSSSLLHENIPEENLQILNIARREFPSKPQGTLLRAEVAHAQQLLMTQVEL